jgi:hypothetical protein
MLDICSLLHWLKASSETRYPALQLSTFSHLSSMFVFLENTKTVQFETFCERTEVLSHKRFSELVNYCQFYRQLLFAIPLLISSSKSMDETNFDLIFASQGFLDYLIS